MHFGNTCSGLSERTWRAKSVAEKEVWLCKSCRQVRGSRLNSAEEVTGDVQWGLTQIKATLENMFTKQFENINDKLDKTLQQLQNATKEIEQLKLINRELKEENKELKERADQMEIEIHHLAQYSRNRNIELHGIPEQQGEKIEEIVIQVGKKLQVDFNNSDFVAHRIGMNNHRKNIPRPIIVQFDKRKIRDNILKNGKQSKLSTKDINMQFMDNPLYVNENLSPYFKKLFHQAKQLKTSHGFRYIWIANSKILVKKQEGSKPVCIGSEKDLKKII
jgi:hypothetical protein